METIGEQKLWTFLDDDDNAVTASCTQVRKGAAVKVFDYMDLAEKVAELQFLNQDFVLLYRGQPSDHRNRKQNTSLKPGLLRPASDRKLPNSPELERRFRLLRDAEAALMSKFESADRQVKTRLQRQRILRWAILQHYEICQTPLLDVTHSLRIAASFASLKATDEAFIFVLGVPNLSGAITASAEAGLQIVRLSSVCPPSARRPHLQEGYLLGEYPEMADFDQKQHYGHYEIDFGRRLVAKFRFDPRTFWKNPAFPLIAEDALYPNADDPLYELAVRVKKCIGVA